MSQMDEKIIREVKSMYRSDSILLCVFEFILICVIVTVLFVVLNLTEDPAVKTIAIVASLTLIVASAFAMLAVIIHLKKNHMDINYQDISQKYALKELKKESNNQ